MNLNTPYEKLASKADTLAEEGDLVGSISSLKEALRAEPHNYQGWLQLSRRLFQAECFNEAIQVGHAAERVDPLQAEFQTIQRLVQNRSLGEAENAGRRMLQKQPGHPRAVFTIAQVAGMKNFPEGRVRALEYGLEHSPANLMLRHLMIGAQEETGNYREAIAAARTLVKIQESFETLWSLVSVLLRHGQNSELFEVCARAEVQAGSDKARLSDIELVRGQILRVMGQRDESIAAYRACLKHNPRSAGAWWALADMKTFDFSSADNDAIEELLKVSEVPQSDKLVATFALAKASETGGDWDQTMALYQRANRLYSGPKFDPSSFKREVTARIEAFNKESLRIQADEVPKGPTPIFILGLPRSGSTLIEQILASHSQIEGTIEQPVMPSIARKAHVKCALDFRGTLFGNNGDLSRPDLAELGAAYVSDGEIFRTGETTYFTDKLPFNFLHLGLIHKVLPNAVIIDARRNPMDCGLSLYKQYFPTGVEFSYDLEHIGVFYNGYIDLMDYWHAVIPGRILTVQHEHLVREPEQKIRELLSHIGVPFEDACLNFHKTDRAVRTASSEQVRQPINSRGIGAWRKVASHLQPLKQSLGANTLARFEADLDY